jgi:hypothetical protein
LAQTSAIAAPAGSASKCSMANCHSRGSRAPETRVRVGSLIGRPPLPVDHARIDDAARA